MTNRLRVALLVAALQFLTKFNLLSAQSPFRSPIKDDSIDLAIYSQKVAKCCSDGTKHAKSYKRCDGMRAIDKNLYPTVHQSCGVARQECCNRQVRKQQCDWGAKQARYRQSCNIYDVETNGRSDGGPSCKDQIERTCCSCCWIGMKVYYEMKEELLADVSQYANNKNYCELMGEYFLDHCRASFLECCMQGPISKTHWRYPDILAIASPESLRRMKCKQGYSRNPISATCEDYNECAFNPCNPGYTCINTIGSYYCQRVTTCGTGYYLAKNNTCIDIDECTQSSTQCPSGTRCVNRPGTYKCEPLECRKGYAGDAAGNCKDIDECAKGIDKCPADSQCENQDGGFTCRCKKGYRFDSRLNECRDIDECRERSHNCNRISHVCRNRPGTFVCLKKKLRCRPGFKPDRYNRRCVDINECVNKALNNCDVKTEKCINENGSFRCEQYIVCQSGTRLNYVDNTCVDIDECRTRRHNCKAGQRCVNMFGTFQCVTDSCQQGFKFANSSNSNYRCIDIDECKESIVNPCGSAHTCRNLKGSYTCYCKTGYQFSLEEGTCVDIDECASAETNTCDHACENSVGDFSCSCPEGYTLNNRVKGKCMDNDECYKGNLPSKVCAEDVCFNTQGAHVCKQIECPEGYSRNDIRGGVTCSRSCVYLGKISDSEPDNTCGRVANIFFVSKGVVSTPTFEKYKNLTMNQGFNNLVYNFNGPQSYGSKTITKWAIVEDDDYDRLAIKTFPDAVLVGKDELEDHVPLSMEEEYKASKSIPSYTAETIQNRKLFKMTNRGTRGDYSIISMQKPVTGPKAFIIKTVSSTVMSRYHKGMYHNVAEDEIRYVYLSVSQNEF